MSITDNFVIISFLYFLCSLGYLLLYIVVFISYNMHCKVNKLLTLIIIIIIIIIKKIRTINKHSIINSSEMGCG